MVVVAEKQSQPLKHGHMCQPYIRLWEYPRRGSSPRPVTIAALKWAHRRFGEFILIITLMKMQLARQGCMERLNATITTQRSPAHKAYCSQMSRLFTDLVLL